MKYAWIDQNAMHFELHELCRVLEVSISGYRSWKRGGSPERKRLTDAQMLALIQAIHAELKGAYGSPRMVRELRARGMPLGLMPGMAYEEKQIEFQPGDSLLLHSDGIVEAHNPDREMFGFEALKGAVARHPGGAEVISGCRAASSGAVPSEIVQPRWSAHPCAPTTSPS